MNIVTEEMCIFFLKVISHQVWVNSVFSFFCLSVLELLLIPVQFKLCAKAYQEVYLSCVFNLSSLIMFIWRTARNQMHRWGKSIAKSYRSHSMSHTKAWGKVVCLDWFEEFAQNLDFQRKPILGKLFFSMENGMNDWNDQILRWKHWYMKKDKMW